MFKARALSNGLVISAIVACFFTMVLLPIKKRGNCSFLVLLRTCFSHNV